MGKFRVTFDNDSTKDRISFDIVDDDIQDVDEAVDEAWRKLVHVKSGEWWYFGEARQLTSEDVYIRNVGAELIFAYDDGRWMIEGWSIPINYARVEEMSVEDLVMEWVRENIMYTEEYAAVKYIGVYSIHDFALEGEEE